MTVGAFSNVATQSYAAGKQIVPINIYAKCNIPVCFEGTSAAIGSISSGAIYVFLIGNVAAGANDGITTFLPCDSSTHDSAVPVNNNFYN